MSVQVIDTLKPKNGLDFPVVEAVDVAVEGYSSLADAVSHFATDVMIDTIIATLATKASTSDLATTNAAVESKADKTTTDNLQSQIDQIAQAAGTGSADTEVAQARVGADGTTYNNLKARLDSENNALNWLLGERFEYSLSGKVERGGIRSDGANWDGDAEYLKSHFRTITYIPNGFEKVSVSATSPYKVKVWVYQGGTVTSSGWVSSYNISEKTSETYKIRIAFTTSDESEFDEYDLEENVDIIYGNAYTEIEQARDRIADIETNIGTINIQSLSTYIRGRVTFGIIYPDYKYRVVSQDIMHTNVALKFTISSGFKFSLHKYDSEGNYITDSDSGWQEEIMINAGEYFRLMIARQTEDTSEIADINFFVGQISSERDITVSAELDEARISDNTVYSSLAERLNADKSSIVSDIDIIKEELDIITMYDLSTYIRGRVTFGIIYPDYKYRVVSADIIHPEKPLKFTVLDLDNFKMSVQKYDSEGNYITDSDSGWQEEIMINAGEYFRLMIARQTEDTSEIADINFFVSQINCEIQKAPLESKDIGAMTGYVKAQAGAAIAPTDTLNEAIGKVEKRVDVNEVSALKLAGIVSTGTNYVEMDNGKRLYISNTTPTDARVGDYGVGFSAGVSFFGDIISDVPPISFDGNGNDLMDYEISGAVGGVGDVSRNLSPALSTWTSGYINAADGNISPQDDIKLEYTSDYIPITAGKGYTFHMNPTGFPDGGKTEQSNYPWRAIAWYTSDKQYISRPNGVVSTPLTETAPSNAAYCRLTYRSFGDTRDIMFCEGNAAIPFEPYGKYIIPITCGGETTNILVDSPLYEGDSISYADTGVTISTAEGKDEFSVRTTVQPANVTIKYSGWHMKGAPQVATEIEYIRNTNIKSINHRGYNTVAPENTISAYKLSKRYGFEYVETDVAFTSDGVPVLLHDSTIDRTSNGTGKIASLTYAQVREYDFGSWKSDNYAGEKIPSFDEFMAFCRNTGLKPYIEIKYDTPYTEAQIQQLVDIAAKYGMAEKTTWISFNATYLGYIADYDSSARLGFLVFTLASADVRTAEALKTDANEVFINAMATSSSTIAECIAAKIPLERWVVNEEGTVLSLDGYISGVTSDILIAGNVLLDNALS